MLDAFKKVLYHVLSMRTKLNYFKFNENGNKKTSITYLFLLQRHNMLRERLIRTDIFSPSYDKIGKGSHLIADSTWTKSQCHLPMTVKQDMRITKKRKTNVIIPSGLQIQDQDQKSVNALYRFGFPKKERSVWILSFKEWVRKFRTRKLKHTSLEYISNGNKMPVQIPSLEFQSRYKTH